MQPVSVFSQEALEQIVRETLPPVDEHHTMAVALTTDQTGAAVTLEFKKIDHHGATWQLEAGYRHTWAGDNQVGTKLIYAR